jgi:hypothetical protein
MSNKTVIRWRKSRAKGMWHFIIINTALWFTATFIFSNLIRWLFGYAQVDFTVISAIFALACSFLVSSINWVRNEKKFANTDIDKNDS